MKNRCPAYDGPHEPFRFVEGEPLWTVHYFHPAENDSMNIVTAPPTRDPRRIEVDLCRRCGLLYGRIVEDQPVTAPNSSG